MIDKSTEQLDPFVLASCLYKCVHQDVCKGCAYIDAPFAYKGNCINMLMDDAGRTLKDQQYRIRAIESLHDSLKKTNKKLIRENRELRKKGGKE